ncbi:MAG: hypothetical protein IJT09_05210 [Abditibacteriota bacterium]|nr:hypothetical protein [Abditibacteriota bacterium]
MIKIISTIVCEGREFAPTDEVLQRLVIEESGKVLFEARNYGQYKAGEGFCRRKTLEIGDWKAKFLWISLAGLRNRRTAKKRGNYSIEFDFSGYRPWKIYGALSGPCVKLRYDSAMSVTRLLRRYIPVSNLWGLDENLSDDYDGRKAIYRFADKWEEKFSDIKPLADEYAKMWWHEESVDERWKGKLKKFDDEFLHSFCYDCESLGFEMDVFETFERFYPGCNDSRSKKLDGVIDSIYDVDLLGWAVYSQWRYWNHWADASMHEPDLDWFLTVFRRMKELTRRGV